MILSQCIERHTSVNSCFFIIMIVAKILLLFPPLLLLANAQSGGNFYSRPNYRRPRPWDRITVAPVPDTPMPTEKVTENIIYSPKARTELTTVAPVRTNSGVPVSSAPRYPQRQRIWARPVFGSRPTATITPAAVTPIKSITLKADNYSPVVSTTESEGYTVPSSTKVPFFDNHVKYNSPNNFNSRGRYSPQLTHNKEEIRSDSIKSSTEIPLITEIITEQVTEPAEQYSPMISSTSTTTESVKMAPNTEIPFMNNHIKYNASLNDNLGTRFLPQTSPHFIDKGTNLKMTPVPLPTPQLTSEPTNYNSRFRFPLHMSHNLNVPTTEIRPQLNPDYYLKTSSITTAATTKLSSSTMESAGYTVASTTKVPFIDEHNKRDDIYLTTKTPIPFKIVTTEADQDTTDRLHIIYQENKSNESNITSELKLPEITTPRGSTSLTIEPVMYMITTTSVPFVDLHKQYGLTSQRSQEYTNVYKENTEVSSTSDDHNAPVYPVYHHEADKVIHYEQSSSATNEPKGYTVSPSTKVPFIDEHNKRDGIYLTTKAPIPFKIVTTEAAPHTTDRLYPIYKENQSDESDITSEIELPKIPTPRTDARLTKEPVMYMITTTSVPFVDVHKQYGFTSQPALEYTNEYNKNTKAPFKSDDHNAPVYPVYNHDADKVSHYEQSSPATRESQGYTVTPKPKIPFIFKKDDVDSTSAAPVEYTNGRGRTTEMPSSDESDELMYNNYQYNHKKNNNKQSWTPKVVSTTQSALAYEYRYPKTTTDAAVTQTIRHTNSYRYVDATSKPTTRYTSTTLRTSHLNKVYDMSIDNFKCKEENAYYSISNQCDDFIECKSGVPIPNTCSDGLHFNPAAVYPEFPCAFPSEVKCESNAVIRQAEPTNECPRHFGYFPLKDGSCDKYIICQGGLATIMPCPPGLAFNEATSSCDWPANVPNCLPNVFEGFTCPAPELNDDGQPTQSIYKYRYEKSCKKYIACQKGHPRLLSCDSGLAFDENSESCVDEIDITDCT